MAISANECGQPATGADRETGFCNTGVGCEKAVDCDFGTWSQWSDCSMTCDGVKRRSRRIDRYGVGDGAFCVGSLKETSPCNPSPNEGPPQGCGESPAVDCLLESWSEWTMCTATCGGGEHLRTRQIVRLPSGGGKPCDGGLSVAHECNRQPCVGPKPVDCMLSAWQEWGACSKCGGQRKRFKNVIRYTANGGRDCPQAEVEQVVRCPRTCLHTLYCTWASWSSWGECSSKCGVGRRGRRREVMATSSEMVEPPRAVHEIMAQYEQLQLQTQAMERNHLQELAFAFTCGCFSLLTGMGVWRIFSRQYRDRMNFQLLAQVDDVPFAA